VLEKRKFCTVKNMVNSMIKQCEHSHPLVVAFLLGMSQFHCTHQIYGVYMTSGLEWVKAHCLPSATKEKKWEETSSHSKLESDNDTKFEDDDNAFEDVDVLLHGKKEPLELTRDPSNKIVHVSQAEDSATPWPCSPTEYSLCFWNSAACL
jgi:hypothetical protein